jgi:1-acyl-sn-glycerol-3-phosphate acyltransferase
MTVEQVRALVSASRPASSEAPERDDASSDPPDWVYTWGRAFRWMSLPFDLLYRFAVTRTLVLGGEHLSALPPTVVLAGTHHSFPDMSLVRRAITLTSGRCSARRLLVATAAGPAWRSVWTRYAVLAFGLYPLQRERDRERSLRRLVRLTQQGNDLLIFPQGTHARPWEERAGDTRVHFRPGIAHIADALQCPVVPFGLAGTERMMPGFLEDFHGPVIAGVPLRLRRGPLAIAFGPPLVTEADEEPAAFASRLQAVCYDLTRAAERALGTR